MRGVVDSSEHLDEELLKVQKELAAREREIEVMRTDAKLELTARESDRVKMEKVEQEQQAAFQTKILNLSAEIDRLREDERRRDLTRGSEREEEKCREAELNAAILRMTASNERLREEERWHRRTCRPSLRGDELRRTSPWTNMMGRPLPIPCSTGARRLHADRTTRCINPWTTSALSLGPDLDCRSGHRRLQRYRMAAAATWHQFWPPDVPRFLFCRPYLSVPLFLLPSDIVVVCVLARAHGPVRWTDQSWVRPNTTTGPHSSTAKDVERSSVQMKPCKR